MSCITVCPACGKCYEACSEEDANDPIRLCLQCYRADAEYRRAARYDFEQECYARADGEDD